MYIGAHVKSSGGVWNAVANGVQIGCDAVQFFAGSPRTWAPTPSSRTSARTRARASTWASRACRPPFGEP